MAVDTKKPPSLKSSYSYCLQIAKNHYENFPVASKWLPKNIRKSIIVIYAFARIADDIADEGDASPKSRINSLNSFIDKINQIAKGEDIPEHLWIALKDVCTKHKLPLNLLKDLIDAFKQDIIKKDYENFNEVLFYCQRSANPIGRLLLHLTNNATPENIFMSDMVCSSLQIINFLQDIDKDINERDRCYFPKDELEVMGITKKDLGNNLDNPKVMLFLELQTLRALNIMQKGKKLTKNVKGFFSFELSCIIAGGEIIGERLLKRVHHHKRPVINKKDILKMLIRAIKHKKKSNSYEFSQVL